MSLAVRRLLAGIVGASLIIGLTAMPLSAARNPEKIFGVAISVTDPAPSTPGNEAPSGSIATFRATITNLTKGNSSYNSFEIGLPNGFTPVTSYAPTIVASDPAQTSATISVGWAASSVTVSGLDPVRQDKWVTVEFKATVKTISGCTDQPSDPWPLHVWTGSDLSGSEFALTPPLPLPTTLITVSCGIEFETQPQDAVQGQVITGTDFDPTAGKVTVIIKNGGAIDTTVNSGSVTLSVLAGTGSGTYVLTGETANFSAGRATFDTLTIADAPGTGGGPAAGAYLLVASYAGLSATSDSNPEADGNQPFTIYDAYVCGNEAYDESSYLSTIRLDSREDPASCYGIIVDSNSDGSFGTEEWLVTKSGRSVFKGFLTFDWTVDATQPIPWTRVIWDGLSDYQPVLLCNPGIDHEDSATYHEGSGGLFPTDQKMCLVDSDLREVVLDGVPTYVQREIIAYNADLGSRKY